MGSDLLGQLAIGLIVSFGCVLATALSLALWYERRVFLVLWERLRTKLFPPVEFYISEDGSPVGDGSAEDPWDTLRCALSEIGRMRFKIGRDFVIHVMGGRHYRRGYTPSWATLPKNIRSLQVNGPTDSPCLEGWVRLSSRRGGLK